MKKKIILVFMIVFVLSIAKSLDVMAQKSNAMFKDNVIKVDLRHPPRQSDRYLNNDKKKKKLKTKYKILYGNECPIFRQYISRPEKEREKLLHKNSNG